MCEFQTPHRTDNAMSEDSHMVKVAVLEERVTSIGEVFTRLESAIEKISDVSVDIKQMLAIHEERITLLDNRVSRTKDQTTTLAEAMAKDAKEQVERVHDLEARILNSQNSSEHRIVTGQEDLKKFFMGLTDANERRIKTLENWRYVLVGMFLVFGALVTLFAQNSITITRLVP